MQKKIPIVVIITIFTISAFILAACGAASSGITDRSSASGTPAPKATGKPFKLGFDEGFTGFMAVDANLTEHGILTALAEHDNQVLGRPIEYVKADNGSDPVQAVDKARQLVESEHIDAMIGPIFGPSVAAVTDFLGRESGIPSLSIFGQPSVNLKNANNLLFIPAGMFSREGYLLGKYASEELGYKTANAISYEDTTGHDLEAGFAKGFAEGGGRMISNTYVPIDTIDFSSYLSTLKPADVTYNWIFGNGTGPFIKQYHDYGLTAPLIMTMADDLQEPVMRELGDLSVGIVGEDHYLSTLDNPINKQFVADYQKMWNGELPNMDSYGGWMAVNMFIEAVKKTNGDTSPDALKKALSTLSLDTPTGTVTMSPYKTAFIGTKDFYISKVEQVDGQYRWMPIYTYKNVLFDEVP